VCGHAEGSSPDRKPKLFSGKRAYWGLCFARGHGMPCPYGKNGDRDRLFRKASIVCAAGVCAAGDCNRFYRKASIVSIVGVSVAGVSVAGVSAAGVCAAGVCAGGGGLFWSTRKA